MGRRTFDRITGSYDRGYAGIFAVCYAGDNVVSVYNYDVYNDTKSCRLCSENRTGTGCGAYYRRLSKTAEFRKS